MERRGTGYDERRGGLDSPEGASAPAPDGADRGETEAGPELDSRAMAPNRTTVAAIEAARRGDVMELGSPADALAELNRDD